MLLPLAQRADTLHMRTKNFPNGTHDIVRARSRKILLKERFVQSGPNIIRTAAMKEHAVATHHEIINKIAVTDRQALGLSRKTLHLSSRQRQATLCKRAVLASRRHRHTLQRSEVHNRLIINSGPCTIQQFAGQGLKIPFSLPRIYRQIYEKVTGQYAEYVAVQYRERLTVSNRTNGRGCIIPNTFQTTHVRIIRRKRTAIHIHYPAGRCVHIAGPAVIPQSLPYTQHLIFRSSRKRRHIRKLFDKTPIIIESLCHPGLLQNYLRYPYMVRIVRPTPRQIALVPVVPTFKRNCKKWRYFRHDTVYLWKSLMRCSSANLQMSRMPSFSTTM